MSDVTKTQRIEQGAVMTGVAVTPPQEVRDPWRISLALCALSVASIAAIFLIPAPTPPDPQERTFQNMDLFWMFENIKVPLAVLAGCGILFAFLSFTVGERLSNASQDAHRRTIRELQEHYQVTFQTEVAMGCPVQEVLAHADGDGRTVALRLVFADGRASAFSLNEDEYRP